MGQVSSSSRLSPVAPLPRGDLREKRRSSTRSLPTSSRMSGELNATKTMIPRCSEEWFSDSAPYHVALGSSEVAHRRGPRSLDVHPAYILSPKDTGLPQESNWSDVASDIIYTSQNDKRQRRSDYSRRSKNNRRAHPIIDGGSEWLGFHQPMNNFRFGDSRKERKFMRQTTKDCAEILEVSGEENDSTNHQIDLKKNERSMIVSKQGATCSGCSQKTKSQKKTINVAVQTNNSDEHKGMAKTLKQLEIENRRLIRESERQKEEYEQMLDVIEKKVLRALLQQKALKTECFRLRKELSLKKNCRCAFLLPSSVGRSDFSSPLTSPAHSLLSVNSLITSGLLESPMINGGEQLCSRPQSFNFDVVDIRRLTAHRHSQLSQEGVTEMTLEAPILPFGSGSFGRFRLPDLQETLGPNEEFTVGACSRVGHLNVSKSSNSNLIAPTLPLDDGYSTMSNEVKGWESQNENVAAILSQRQKSRSLISLPFCLNSSMIPQQSLKKKISYSDSEIPSGLSKFLSQHPLTDRLEDVEYAIFKGYADMEGHGWEAMADFECYRTGSCSSLEAGSCEGVMAKEEFDAIYETIKAVRPRDMDTRCTHPVSPASATAGKISANGCGDCQRPKEKKTATNLKEPFDFHESNLNADENISPTLQLWAAQLGQKHLCKFSHGNPKVVRYTAGSHRRPTIMKKSVFYPFGRLERAALADFEFLNRYAQDSDTSLTSEVQCETDVDSVRELVRMRRSRSWTDVGRSVAQTAIKQKQLLPGESQSILSSCVSMQTSCASSLFLSDLHPEVDGLLSSSGSSLSFHMTNS